MARYVNKKNTRQIYRKIATLLLLAVLTILSALIPAQDTQALSGTYYLECDQDGANEYIIYFWESGTDWTRWQDHVVARLGIRGMHYQQITINGNQRVDCRNTNGELKVFNNATSALNFIKWAVNDSSHQEIAWQTNINGDKGALLTLYLGHGEYPGSDPPDTYNQWDQIGMVTCKWTTPDLPNTRNSGTSLARYDYLIEYYSRGDGRLLTSQWLNNTHSSCERVFSNEIQLRNSPSNGWKRQTSGSLTYIMNPNGATNAWELRGNTTASPTICMLSANPQLENAMKRCRVSMFGDALFNNNTYNMDRPGFFISRVSATSFDLIADDSIREIGESSKITFWRAGATEPQGTRGPESRDLVEITVNRIANLNGPTDVDWWVRDIRYMNCSIKAPWYDMSNDFCIRLNGDGRMWPNGGYRPITVTRISGDTGATWMWKPGKESEELDVKVSNFRTSYLTLRFCLVDEDGNTTTDCRNAVINPTLVTPPDENEECPEGWIMDPDGNCIRDSEIDPGSGSGKPDGCFEGGGAMGWILCPILDGLGKMAQRLYDDVVAPLLAIDVRLFNDNSSDGTFRAWTIFQTFANIVFIILLLVVIFSQVTGVGIDNYGIKKILPKLIIAAILINLSYIICRLAIDVSNIVGYGGRQLFASIDITPVGENAADGIFGEALQVKDNSATTANVVTVVIGILIGGVGIATIATGGLAILLPLLTGLLSAAIAIFFVFILLGVRQAGVVLLTVLAPVAIVCYILPNTKKLFDRWLKMFTGLLLLFPIVGLLVGGSELASRIIISTDTNNFWIGLIALLLGVIPFFFIPTLLKASFAAMGNMGAKISGFGSGFNRKVGGVAKPALANSRLGQAMQRGKNYRQYKRGERNKYNQEQLQKRREQKTLDNLSGRTDLSDRQRRNLAVAARTVDASDKQQLADTEIALARGISSGNINSSERDLIRRMSNSQDKNEQYAIARHLSGYKNGVDALSNYINENERNVFSGSQADRKAFSAAMQDSKNFGNVGKFSPELEEYTLNTSNTSMAAASHGASLSGSKVSTATEASLQRMWSASAGEDNRGRREQLVNSMRQAMENPNTRANIKESEFQMMNTLINHAADIDAVNDSLQAGRNPELSGEGRRQAMNAGLIARRNLTANGIDPLTLRPL